MGWWGEGRLETHFPVIPTFPFFLTFTPKKSRLKRKKCFLNEPLNIFYLLRYYIIFCCCDTIREEHIFVIPVVKRFSANVLKNFVGGGCNLISRGALEEALDTPLVVVASQG